jgi:hypothetical protein
MHSCECRVFEIRQTEGGRFSAGPTEASYIVLGGPIVRQTFCCCFVCNGFAKHVRGY